jgi:death-on-curing protein
MTEYLTVDEVLIMHEILMRRFGGATGVRDSKLLEAAIFRPQSGYYADTISEAAALFESLLINHPFVDGNKRMAFAAMDVFLRINGYKLNVDSKEAYQAIMAMLEDQSLDVNGIDQWLRGKIN